MTSKLMHRLSPREFRRAAEGAGRDPTTMARAIIYFFAAGATLATVDLLVRNGSEASVAAQAVPPAVAYAVATFVLVAFDRLPHWAYGTMMALGTVLISSDVYFGGGAMSALVLLYCWVALYAGHFHRVRWAVLQIGFIGVAYGAVLTARGGGALAVEHWIVGMGTVAMVAAVVLSLRYRLEGLIGRLGETARTDALTGLLNRRGFLERLETQLESARRGERPPSLVFGDFDGFKRLNDRFGHEAGDAALRRCGEIFEQTTRRIDVAGRIGGEEFALVVPGSDGTSARRLAERLRVALGEAFAADAVPLTMSFGIATFPLDGEDCGELMRSADRALYAAKADGGDCSVVCSQGAELNGTAR